MNATKLTDQQQLVMDYLNTHAWITGTLSVTVLGVMDLRKRVSELRRLGFPIEDRSVTRHNRYGKKVTFKEYFLQKGEDDVRVSAAESR